jgi:hypothetical protein
MASNQRKSSDVMIEGRCATPIVLAMTSLATRAELAVVPVVLPVTRYACRCELVAIEVAGVASIARDLRVGSFQRKSCCLGVVEMDRAPLALVMAAIAFRAVPPRMDILNPVALDACFADALVPFADMARWAGDSAMSLPERKQSLVVIERLELTPCRLEVATIA